MGKAERNNPNSKWNKRRTASPEAPVSQVASPISTDSKKFSKAVTPVSQDEPMVMELTLSNIWGLLCRMLRLPRPQSPAPTS